VARATSRSRGARRTAAPSRGARSVGGEVAELRAQEALREEFANAISRETRHTVALQLGRGTAAAYARLRDAVEPLIDDRPLDTDIRTVWSLIEQGFRLFEDSGDRDREFPEAEKM